MSQRMYAFACESLQVALQPMRVTGVGVFEADPAARHRAQWFGIIRARSVSSRICKCMPQCMHTRARELARVALQAMRVT